MPSSLLNTGERSPQDRAGDRPLTWSVRGALVLVVVALVAAFGVAFWIQPYDAEGDAERLGTHRQLGLPECSFKVLTGKPCPSCGLTTSFALLVRGDVTHSLRANWVGTLLAVFCLLVIPWGVASLVRGRLFWVGSLERALTWVVGIFLTLLLVRWAVVVGPDFFRH